MSLRDSKDLVEFWRAESRLLRPPSAPEALAPATTAPFILAEIISTEGATYRKAGAKKIIAASGAAKGLLSGGCLEGAIVQEALKFLNDGGASIVLFDTSNESDRLLGFQKGCHGKISVAYSKLPFYEDAEARKIFKDLQGSRRLVIFGCGPDAAPLSELLGQMGYPHILIDHRRDFALKENFTSALAVMHEAPGTSARHVQNDDAVLLMSHNFEADLHIMVGLADKKLSYIGFLGPRERYRQLISDLPAFMNQAWPERHAAVSHAPVGIKMPCRDPHDIALAIVAELTTLDIFGVKNGLMFKAGSGVEGLAQTVPNCSL